jgi:hypothetical protein
MKNDRPRKPPGRPAPTTSRSGPRKGARAFEPGSRRPAPARPPRDRGDFGDPYKPARRPPREFTPRGDDDAQSGRGDRGRFSERGSFADRGRGERGERSARGFTVNLDPDVARVFRGDASVNRALRLVLQLMQVVQGPPQHRDRAPRGYQGSPEARGFTRKPRFVDDEGGTDESDE